MSAVPTRYAAYATLFVLAVFLHEAALAKPMLNMLSRPSISAGSGSDVILSTDNHTYYTISYFGNAAWTGSAGWKTLTTYTPVPCRLVDDDPEDAVSLPFNFPFFGHLHDQIYISPNGFIQMYKQSCSKGFCNWDSDADKGYDRYIAPFMTDFNPGAWPGKSFVMYFYDSSDNTFTVEWRDVVLRDDLRDKTNTTFPAEDAFTFQLVLKPDGNIVFNYQKVPFNPATRKARFDATTWVPPGQTAPRADNANLTYPVYVGAGDSIIRADDVVSFIIKYSTVKIATSYPLSRASVLMTALTTCPQFTTCSSCLAFRSIGRLECGWCDASSVCSDGLGREIAELTYACPDISQLALKCALDPNDAVIDDSIPSASIAIAVVICVSVCLAGTVFYIKKRKQERGLDSSNVMSMQHVSKPAGTGAAGSSTASPRGAAIVGSKPRRGGYIEDEEEEI